MKFDLSPSLILLEGLLHDLQAVIAIVHTDHSVLLSEQTNSHRGKARYAPSRLQQTLLA